MNVFSAISQDFLYLDAPSIELDIPIVLAVGIQNRFYLKLFFSDWRGVGCRNVSCMESIQGPEGDGIKPTIFFIIGGS